MTLDVVSINIVHIAISLCNLVILYLILKKFLYKPVKKVMDQRAQEVSDTYDRAKKAEMKALVEKEHYEAVMEGVAQEADAYLREKKEDAKRRSSRILSDAQTRKDEMMRDAEREIALEKQKMRDDMKKEMADVTVLLTEKVLGREMNDADQRSFIDRDLAQLEASDDAFGR